MICARCKILDRWARIVNVQWAIPEPTAVAMLETQRFLFSPAQEYSGVRGGDVGRCAAEIDTGAT